MRNLFDVEIERGATFSPCRTWRYALWRDWNAKEDGWLAFIGLNPSTADENQDDPTIRRCLSFARDLGYGGLVMLNLFAYRSTDPKALRTAEDPVGPENDRVMQEWADVARMTVAAWGVHGRLKDRDVSVANAFERLHCLGWTKDGDPRHPLYLPASAKPVKFQVRKICPNPKRQSSPTSL